MSFRRNWSVEKKVGKTRVAVLPLSSSVRNEWRGGTLGPLNSLGRLLQAGNFIGRYGGDFSQLSRAHL